MFNIFTYSASIVSLISFQVGTKSAHVRMARPPENSDSNFHPIHSPHPTDEGLQLGLDFKADATSYHFSALSFALTPHLTWRKSWSPYNSCLSLTSSYLISSHNPLYLLHARLTGLCAIHLVQASPSVWKALPSCPRSSLPLTTRSLLQCHLSRGVIHPWPTCMK